MSKKSQPPARNLFSDDDETPVESPVNSQTNEPTIPELIKRRRAQMLLHSCIYYELNDNIISDHLWQQWADELQVLQEKHPEHLQIGFYDKAFKDWDGATGTHLPLRDPWVLRKSRYLLYIRDELGFK